MYEFSLIGREIISVEYDVKLLTSWRLSHEFKPMLSDIGSKKCTV